MTCLLKCGRRQCHCFMNTNQEARPTYTPSSLVKHLLFCTGKPCECLRMCKCIATYSPCRETLKNRKMANKRCYQYLKDVTCDWLTEWLICPKCQLSKCREGGLSRYPTQMVQIRNLSVMNCYLQRTFEGEFPGISPHIKYVIW